MVEHSDCPRCHGAKLNEFTRISNTEITCPFCGCLIKDVLIIKIVRTPAGPAPQKVREAWVGLNLVAEADRLQSPEVDFLRGDMVIRERAYMVPKELALESLEKKSPEAANWFRVNFPSHMVHLTFAPNEVEIVEQIRILDTGEPLDF